MAKTIATIGGIGLVPGVSKNRRWYKPEHVEQATKRLQERIASGDSPAIMLSFHAAGDASREITASLTSAALDEGRLRFTAAIADTVAGRDIAALADTSDGNPAHLKTVSIRGGWLGTVRTVKGPDGKPCETSDGGIVIDGIDWTKSPGVDGAQIDTFAWTDHGAKTETDQRVLITESVQEALLVPITEETTAEGAAGHLREAFERAFPEPPHILEDGLCVTCAPLEEASVAMGKRSSGLAGAGKVWADPGYQSDKKQRYDLSSKANAKSAWSYISQADNAKKYTAAQLKRVKGRIKKALQKFGVNVAAEGWTIDAAAEVGEALAECYAMDCDPGKAGSWSINASNGPVTLNLSSYGMDPAELDVILRAAVDGACAALQHLDPDMDGDIDVDGAPNASTDGGESALDDEDAEETTPAGQAGEEAAEAADTQEDAVGDTTTPQAAAGAPATITLTDEQFKALVGRGATEAAPAAQVTETEDQRVARLVAEAIAKQQPAKKDDEAVKPASDLSESDEATAVAARTAALIAEAQGPQKTQAERIEEAARAAADKAIAEAIASGQIAPPSRKGNVVKENGPAAGGTISENEHGLPADWPNKPLHTYTDEERARTTDALMTMRTLRPDQVDKLVTGPRP